MTDGQRPIDIKNRATPNIGYYKKQNTKPSLVNFWRAAATSR
jgi:hypothetical protein